MSKLQDIRELAQEHATSVSSSPRDWIQNTETMQEKVIPSVAAM